MSIVSNIHTFTALSKNSQAFEGQRLCKLISKESTKNGRPENLQESLCVSIPRISIEEVSENVELLIPHLIGLLENTQDKIIREFRLESGRNEIPENVFSVSECIAFLDEESKGGRVTKEYLSEWFSEGYKDIAIQWISNAMSGASAEVVEKKYNVLRDMFTGFSSGKYSPPIPVLKSMEKFGEYISASACECDSRMTSYLQKASALRIAKEEELNMNALGF